jgi:hypothetical protein
MSKYQFPDILENWKTTHHCVLLCFKPHIWDSIYIKEHLVDSYL